MTNRLAVVTGAGSGLGRGIALKLAADGFAIASIDIDQGRANETAKKIGAAGGTARAYAADVSSAKAFDAAMSAAIKDLGALEVMVNNAGVLDGYFDVDETEESLWRRVIEIDLTSVFLGCKRALAEMLPQKRGRIVNMSSVAGLNGTGGGAAYVAAKHGVIGLTRQMAVTYAARGIRVNAVCPGAITTDLRANSQAILGPGVPDMSKRGVVVNEEQVRALVPVGTRGTIENVADAVSFLASEASSYVNGHAMVIDGGGGRSSRTRAQRDEPRASPRGPSPIGQCSRSGTPNPRPRNAREPRAPPRPRGIPDGGTLCVENSRPSLGGGPRRS